MEATPLLDEIQEYRLSYTGNDGLYHETDWTGTQGALSQHAAFLEEHGCHSLAIYKAGSEIYSQGTWR